MLLCNFDDLFYGATFKIFKRLLIRCITRLRGGWHSIYVMDLNHPYGYYIDRDGRIYAHNQHEIRRVADLRRILRLKY
jgi:hypothetical protein